MTSLFFDFVARRRMNVASLITHRVSPLDADEVYNVDRRGNLKPQPSVSCSTGRGCRLRRTPQVHSRCGRASLPNTVAPVRLLAL